MTGLGKLVQREASRRPRQPASKKPAFDYLDESTWPEDKAEFTTALWAWMKSPPSEAEAP